MSQIRHSRGVHCVTDQTQQGCALCHRSNGPMHTPVHSGRIRSCSGRLVPLKRYEKRSTISSDSGFRSNRPREPWDSNRLLPLFVGVRNTMLCLCCRWARKLQPTTAAGSCPTLYARALGTRRRVWWWICSICKLLCPFCSLVASIKQLHLAPSSITRINAACCFLGVHLLCLICTVVAAAGVLPIGSTSD